MSRTPTSKASSRLRRASPIHQSRRIDPPPYHPPRCAHRSLCKGGHLDNWWCAAALAKGYDSIQFRPSGYVDRVFHASRRARNLTEIVVCSHPPQPACGVCPMAGLQMRTGIDASEPCHCDESIGILNCGPAHLRPTPCTPASGFDGRWQSLAEWAAAQWPIGVPADKADVARWHALDLSNASSPAILNGSFNFAPSVRPPVDCSPNRSELRAAFVKTLQRYMNLSVPSLLPVGGSSPPRSADGSARLLASPLPYDNPPTPHGGAMVIMPEHYCAFEIGNHLHELMNAAMIALALGLRLKRTTTAAYTCVGLLASSGLYSRLPLHAPATTRDICRSGCSWDHDVRTGSFRLTGPPNATYNVLQWNTNGRFQSQEGAMVRRLPLSPAARSLFEFGPHALLGRIFSDFFRFKTAAATRVALGELRADCVKISVHMRHRDVCMKGGELLPPVLQAISQIARGRPCQVLLASDRRRTATLLQNLTSCSMIAVARGAPQRGKFLEHGIDAGAAAAADIELLAQGDHVIGTFGSTFTMLIQEQVAHRYVTRSGLAASEPSPNGHRDSRSSGSVLEEPTVTYCESVGCMQKPLPLIASWHVSLQGWPAVKLWVDGDHEQGKKSRGVR